MPDSSEKHFAAQGVCDVRQLPGAGRVRPGSVSALKVMCGLLLYGTEDSMALAGAVDLSSNGQYNSGARCLISKQHPNS